MITINNSFEEWQELYNIAVSGSISENKIQVRIGREEEPEGNILNLCYFFPLASWLYEKGRISKGSPLLLDIQFHRDGLSKDPIQDPGDFQRIESFLSVINKDLCFRILCNGKAVENRDISKLQASRIFPLCVVGDGKEEVDYLVLKKSILEREEEWSQSQNIFFRLAELNIENVKKYKYSGTSDRKFTLKEKDMLRAAVNSYLEHHLDEMDVLSKIVWMYILRELIEEKILYTVPEDTADMPAVRENVLSKSRMDAIAYGEAIYQLIENSCIHSSGKKAWFGIRIHRAGKNEPFSRLVKEAQTRKQLYDKYEVCISAGKDGKKHENNWNIFDKDYRFYLEFYVLDSAVEQLGMVPNYNGSRNSFEQKGDISVSEKRVEHIRELFDIMPDKSTIEKYVEDTTVHYGLSLLRDIIYANRGYLIGKSPNHKNCSQYYYDGLSDEKDKDIYVTEWNALVPISDYWYEITGEFLQTESTNNLFGNQVEDVSRTVSYCGEEQIYRRLFKTDKQKDEQKQYDIDTVKSNLGCIFDNIDRHLNAPILVLDIKDDDGYKMEILSKALFARIVKVNFGKENDSAIPLYIALIVPTVNAAHEFVRLFSIFYRRGSQTEMENVQIALCSYKKGEAQALKVDFILAGKSLAGVMENAKAFAYHYTEDSLEYIPLLAYLTQKKGGQSEEEQKSVTPVFPFDLFLTNHIEELNGKRLDINTTWKKSLFTNHIKKILNTDLRSGKLGCRLKDIHIRLGSKVHVDTFYEAELLFHNTGNVLRFAYLMTQRLLYGDNLLHRDCPVLLLGYEKYSSSLILQIEYWLKQAGFISGVYSAVVYNEPASGRITVNCNFDKKRVSVVGTIQPVIIVPVGTTLSTLYKIRKAALNQLTGFEELKKAEFNWNYCLIVANHNLFNKDANKEIMDQYWNSEVIDREKQSITLRHENKKMPAMQSKYMIAADAEWHTPWDCEICQKYGKNIRPIIDMKYTDTIPGAIFSLLEEREGTFEKLVKNPETNRHRMQILLGHIQYAHIYSGYNHFQFIFDFRSLFSQNEEMILKEIKTWRVEPAAFHILVSPLQMTNSAFIKALIDYVFRGNVRFLRLEFKDAYREEVRAKFSYVIEDFKRLKISDNKARIHVHYADTSIVMGNTINRARLLVKMLLNQSGLPHEDIELFSKIYLLVNRCSYDTIHYFVKNPTEDLKAFIQLSIPSYNTENDSCPACRLTEKYELLEKRSSTQRISSEFAWLGEKHDKRTKEGYYNWIHEAIKEKNAYLGWLKQWLYVNVPSQGKEVLDFLPSEPKELRKEVWYEDWERSRSEERKKAFDKAKKVKKVIDDFYADFVNGMDSDIIKNEQKQYEWLDSLNHLCLKDIAIKVNDDTFLDDAVDLIYSQLIATHDYMRLEAMQKAYEKIEKSHETEEYIQYASVRKIMLKLIADVIIGEKEGILHLKGIPAQEAKRFLLVRNIEWMMSYFKVLAREQISNYYDCRQAVMGIIYDTMNLMKEGGFEQYGKRLAAEDKSWEKIINVLEECCQGSFCSEEPQLTSSLQYQFQVMLLHRMAHLQSVDVAKMETVRNMVESYDKLLTRYFSVFAEGDKPDSVRHLELPSRDRFLLRYLKSAKTATMTTRDDIPCLMIEENLVPHKSEFLDERLGDNKNKAFNLIKKYLFLENVKILYYGMRELEDQIPLDIEKRIDRSVDSFSSNMHELNEKVQRSLQTCYRNAGKNTSNEDILYQNALSVFCRFWGEGTGEVTISPDQNKIITYMFHYYRLLSYLSDDRTKSFLIDDMPYLYEELCRCMCGITDSQMCYIAFQGDGDMPEIFTQSGYYAEYISDSHHKILTPQDMELVLRRSCAVWGSDDEKNDDKYRDYMLIPGIAVLSEKEKDNFLVIRIAQKDAKFGKSYFYIVLQMKKIDAVKDGLGILRNARNILFMREKLQTVLSKDYTILINFRFDCSYIKPYRKENRGKPIVLHISDLHVKEKLDSDDNVIIDNVVEYIGRRLCNQKVDLLAVTGDLIDSHDASAPKVEQNYQNAAKLLDRIVQVLWKDEEGYIPHDWKRRIMIVTGNHDYASMNQFRAVLKHRTLEAGLPVDGESGTMSKFAYYIDFLIKYLDPPIDQLLNNDLNEIRFYRNLGIKVLMLNFSSKATPRRTNKMGVNAEKVRALINSNLWVHASTKPMEASTELFRLCLTHYAPNYVPNYFLDHYDALPGWMNEPAGWVSEPNKRDIAPINKLVDCFILSAEEKFLEKYGLHKNTGEVVNGESGENGRSARSGESGESGQQGKQCNRTEEFLKEASYLMEALKHLQGKSIQMTAEIKAYYKRLDEFADKEVQKQSLANKGKAIEKIVGQFEKNDFYQQLLSYVSWCEMVNVNDDSGYRQSNEQISRLLTDVHECLGMSDTDKENYNKIKAEIEAKDPIDLYLGGHVHTYQENTKEKILIADKLYRLKGKEVNGYIVTIQPEDENEKYRFERL